MFRAHFSSGLKPFYVITEMQPERTTQEITAHSLTHPLIPTPPVGLQSHAADRFLLEPAADGGGAAGADHAIAKLHSTDVGEPRKVTGGAAHARRVALKR